MAEKQGERLVRVPPSFAEKARIGSKDRYRALYDRSLVRPRRVLGRAGRAHPLVQAVGQGLALGLQDGQGRVVHRRQDQRVLQLPRPARGGPAQEQGGADQPRGLALVPPPGRRRPLPDRRHLVADRDRRNPHHAAAGRHRPEAGLGDAAVLRSRADHRGRPGQRAQGRLHGEPVHLAAVAGDHARGVRRCGPLLQDVLQHLPGPLLHRRRMQARRGQRVPAGRADPARAPRHRRARHARRDPLGPVAAQDALRQDHAPHPAQGRRRRVRPASATPRRWRTRAWSTSSCGRRRRAPGGSYRRWRRRGLGVRAPAATMRLRPFFFAL